MHTNVHPNQLIPGDIITLTNPQNQYIVVDIYSHEFDGVAAIEITIMRTSDQLFRTILRFAEEHVRKIIVPTSTDGY